VRKKIVPDLMSLVGKTPLVYLDKIAAGSPGRLAAKLECFNPTGSVKDRIVLNMLNDAEKRGYLQPDSVIVEPTSGNTGIGLACFCAIKGYRLVLTMPDTMSHERRKLLSAYGAELVITPGERGMRGAIEKAEELMEEYKNTFMLQQFNNTSNPEAHERTTAVEIWDDSASEVDCVVAGIGTGGTMTGIAKFLKKKKKSITFVAVEPKGSPVLSGGKPGQHAIQGIGPGFIPRVFDTSCVDEVIAVSDEDAVKTCRLLSRKEGILAGISSGAAAWAALKLAKREENGGKLIVVIFPDGGGKYLSMGLYE
jgi:cysteine synthase A